MVDIKARAVGNYVLELVAGLIGILAALFLLSSIFRVDVIGIVISLVLIAGCVWVFKRPSRARRAS